MKYDGDHKQIGLV